MDNLEEIDKFLERYNLPRLNQKEIENLNQQITTPKIETVIRKHSKVMTLQVNSIKYLKNSHSIKHFLLKIFPKKFRGRDTPKFILQGHNDITKKQNYRPISLNNTNTKILNKILASQIQQYITRILCH